MMAQENEQPEGVWGGKDCPPETLLEAYVTGEGNFEAPAPIVRHVESCVACHGKVEVLGAEFREFSAVLAAHGGEPEGPCLTAEELAEYLDGGPSLPIGGREDEATARAGVVRHLSQCRDCQRRAVALQREVRAVLDAGVSVETVEVHPRGEAVSYREAKTALAMQDQAADQRHVGAQRTKSSEESQNVG